MCLPRDLTPGAACSSARAVVAIQKVAATARAIQGSLIISVVGAVVARTDMAIEMAAQAQGAPPLSGLKVVELAGLAPGPFCGQLLSSYGASVLRIDRPTAGKSDDILTAHKSSITLDLKLPDSKAILDRVLQKADVLLDVYRPGVLERLGLGPDALRKCNPRLIIVHITGFRRDGPYKDMAGHDINYLAASGLLSMLGSPLQPPLPPANILGDYAGGGLVAFNGVLLALLHRATSGRGQVVEANIVDGVSYIGTIPRLRSKEPVWSDARGSNLLDGGCPYYRCYECKDKGKYVSVGALEAHFFAKLLEGLDLKAEEVLTPGLQRGDKRSWARMQAVLEERFRTKTRAQWESVFLDTDACVVPVLAQSEMEHAGYEQRPIVTLTDSPSRPVESPWIGKRLRPGSGGSQTLQAWLGWREGIEFAVENGISVMGCATAKL